MTPEQTAKVAELNDLVRKEMKGGKWVRTQGVMATQYDGPGLYAMVARFEDFTEANNPHGERDAGVIKIADHVFFWKIDVFRDAECMYGAEEPWNPDASYRILTLMLMEEY
ncbi:DUF3768 domain-containing protein [Brevundimonas sp.]|uniref:DUF3768 domain-containing protein n=1 Tax=Brevundimonas sp. TaxID=1871086 RepID=UPI00289AA00B|nr:DUF3768 domain-containing protein [Brevundimonas sp.]